MDDVTFKVFDAAEHLETEADMATYLEAASEGGDPAAIALALGAIARARNMSQLARKVGISREGLYKALSAEGNPSFATVAKIARALGFTVTLRRSPPVETDAA